MSAGMLFWLTYQGMWNYFEVFKRQDVPNPFLGDVVLFLHLVPMIAALAVLPHLREDERDERIRMLDFTLLLIWWVFIYVYAVIPWQTVQVDEAVYSANLQLRVSDRETRAAGRRSPSSPTPTDGGWRQLYGQLLGASALYASSSYVANWAIAHNLYYSGSLYDIPLTVSIAWMACGSLARSPPRPVRLQAVAACARRLDHTPEHARSVQPPLGRHARRTGSRASGFGQGLPHYRKSLAMVVMGVVVFWRQRLLRDELSQFLEKSRRSFDDLKALQEKLIQSEKLASLGQLVGGAAHEINNPLTAMLGYSDLLSASDLPPEEQLQAAQIGEQVRRTTTLVASLLTFARQAPARLAAVDINSVLQTAVRLLAPQLEAEASSVRLELAPSLPPVLADSNQILHVCMHLAGQISVHFHRETNPRCWFARTRRRSRTG